MTSTLPERSSLTGARRPVTVSPHIIQKASDNDCCGSLGYAQWAVALLSDLDRRCRRSANFGLNELLWTFNKSWEGTTKKVLETNTAFEILLFWLWGEPATSEMENGQRPPSTPRSTPTTRAKRKVVSAWGSQRTPVMVYTIYTLFYRRASWI